MNLPSDASGPILIQLGHTAMPPAVHSQQLLSRLAETHPHAPGTGIGGVLVFVDSEPNWEDMLPLAIHLARELDAPLQLAALPTADGSSRLEQLHSELVNWDYRTLPRGLVCVESSSASAAALPAFAQAVGCLLVITRGGQELRPNAIDY